MKSIDFSGLPTPLYLYDIDILRRTLELVRSLSQNYGFKVHYALKANFEREIVELIAEYGLGADCVSGGEVRLALECGIAPSDILFAGVGKSDREITYAIESEVGGINCESAEEFFVIQDIAKSLGKVANVSLRLNPDVKPETHKFISTGQKESKFGISDSDLKRIIKGHRECTNINIVGLHFHIGSQIQDLTIYSALCRRVNSYIEEVESAGITVHSIDVGGGLGINYDDPDSEPIANFETYFKIFSEGIKLRDDQTLHLEPGRSIVGQCGTLITKVLYIKEITSTSAYAIVDAGMTDLMRPALYGAKHKIEALSGAGDTIRHTIGGPVCESSDIFRHNIKLPRLKRGDILAIRSAGAYGSSMSSNYNLRERAPKYFLEGGKLREL